MPIDWGAIQPELEEILRDLEGLSIDREQTDRLAAGVASGRLSADSNRLRENPEPAKPDDVDDVARFEPDETARYADLGRAAIERGEVAAAVLNGGMATRFGGAVKGIVEAFGGRTFLEIKLAQARRLGPVPVLAMNSFATHAATRTFLTARGLEAEVRPFLQSVALRLTTEGALFRSAEGALSPYAPGHGDFPEALRRSGALGELEEHGVRVVVLSNVDNLGAELDPTIVGYHLARGLPLTVEVTTTLPGDVGGAPMHVGGRLQLIEGFRFPAGYDFGALRYCNTNTLLFSISALRETHPLEFYYVEKDVDGRKAVQFERLVGELSAFVDTAYLATPRSGSDGRFLPVKDRKGLEALRADAALVERFTRA